VDDNGVSSKRGFLSRVASAHAHTSPPYNDIRGNAAHFLCQSPASCSKIRDKESVRVRAAPVWRKSTLGSQHRLGPVLRHVTRRHSDAKERRGFLREHRRAPDFMRHLPTTIKSDIFACGGGGDSQPLERDPSDSLALP
jgi:hypothetical protein